MLGLEVTAIVGDPVIAPVAVGGFDVVLAGDVLYDVAREHVWPWLRAQATNGARVLVADNGRLSQPLPGMRPIWAMLSRRGTIGTVYEVDVSA